MTAWPISPYREWQAAKLFLAVPLSGLYPNMATEYRLTTESITLGQLIKALDLVSSGGEVKYFLHALETKVNGEFTDQRGRQLRDGDIVELPDGRQLLIKARV